MKRVNVAALALSASTLVGIALHEGYVGQAHEPVKGDVPTIGFGTTEGVKMGDSITPERALVRLLADANKFEAAVRRCAPVPMYQYEFDAYVSLTYNIGEGAFCRSTLVKYLNEGRYEEACEQILRWDKFKGSQLKGLTIRRNKEYKQCLGQ
jgi:lysozyme